MINLHNFSNGTVHSERLHKQVPLADDGICTTTCCGALVQPELDRPEVIPIKTRLEDARDFIKQYYDALGMVDGPQHSQRMEEVRDDLMSSGTYTHTLQELEFAVKTAWRNASRCIGRIQWRRIKVFDARHVRTASDMFECLKEHLEYATNGGNIRSVITIFPPKQEGRVYRVWNGQLVQYAGYKRDGVTIGDPINLEMTQLIERLGWKGKGGRFDLLPLLLQADGNDPEWFELSPELILEVQIRHPDFPWFKELGLKWYSLPAVANMNLEVGGLEYTGAPFNGWYMGTEVGARDLCDVHRYNILPTVGKLMGLDVQRPTSLWKDRALVEVNVAVLHSFQTDRVTMTDHHSASESFLEHMAQEVEERGGCPADWVWIVPPISGSVCPVFHQEMVKYVLKPAYSYQEAPWTTDNFGMPCLYKDVQKRVRETRLSFVALVRCIMALLALWKRRESKRTHITVLYATETGRSLIFSKKVVKSLENNGCSTVMICMSDYDVRKFSMERNLLIVASTFGSGEPPENGRAFWNDLKNIPLELGSLSYSILALGSSLYANNLCKFGKDMAKFLSARGASSICPLQEADELKGQEAACTDWLRRVVTHYAKGSSLMTATICRCRFLDRGVMTPATEVLGSLNDVKIKLMEIKKSKKLNAKGTMPRYFDLSLGVDERRDLEGYEPGDHIQVHPGNRRNDVQMMLSKLKVTGAEHTKPLQLEVLDSQTGMWTPDDRFPRPVSLMQTLTWFLDHTAPATTEFLQALRKSVRLQQLLPDTNSHYEESVHDSDVYLEVLRRAEPLSVPPELLLHHMPTIRPRKYSVSTSPLYETKHKINITFKEVVYLKEGTYLKGLTTGFMGSLPKGYKMLVSFAYAHGFRLSLAGPRPVLMVAQGTGIVPFRAFWRHKVALHKNWKNTEETVGALHLFYGCRNPDVDNLFKKEIQAMKSSGILAEVKIAYSRHKKLPKMHIQDLLVAHADYVGELMYNQRASVYYCGDLNNWVGICSLLSKALQQHTSMSEEKADIYIEDMKTDRRLLRDVFME